MFIPSMINMDGDVRHTYEGGETWLLKSTDSFELIQFTGLKDKNGKDIYEGDIINYKIKSTPISTNSVVFKREVKITEEGLLLPFFDYCPEYLIWDMEFYEVIGNIYETPNLL